MTVLGIWRDSQESSVWSDKSTDQRVNQAALKKALKQRQEAIDAEHAAARVRAEAMMESAGPLDPGHHYLKAKGVGVYGEARSYGEKVLLPYRDASGRITTTQTVDPTGAKRFLKGGEKKAAFLKSQVIPDLFILPRATQPARRSTRPPAAVIVCGDAQPAPVSAAIRQKYPDTKIVFCADDDHWTRATPE